MNWFKSFWKRLTVPPGDGTQGAPGSATNYSPRAQQTLALARKEADRLHHNYIGTEHLLLGLIQLGQGVAVNVLQKLGLDLETVRLEIEKEVGRGPDQKIIGSVPYTPRVKKVLALAAKESFALNHIHVGTEHILLGLLREGDGMAARVLRNQGVDVEQTRRAILHELSPVLTGGAKAAQPSEASRPAGLPKLPLDSIDTSRRYDVYCRERDQWVVVYRNALFKGRRKLLSAREHDFAAEFLELEQSNGQVVYLSLLSVIRFCEHGTEIVAEIVPPT